MDKISNTELKALQAKGFFNSERNVFSDAMPTFTAQNIGMPAGILTALNPQAVENILALRTGDLALGKREKLLDWADEKYFTPMIERTGQTTPYSDFGMPLVSGLNANFNETGHYRFTAKYQHGNLEAAQYQKGRINYQAFLLSAVTEALAVELNNVAFNGYIKNSSLSYVCYGLLNNPELPDYEQSLKTFDAMDWQEVMNFFTKAVTKLTQQTGNNINGESRIRVVISASAFNSLKSKWTNLGISAYEKLQQLYPNMYFVSAIELDKAEQNNNVIYFIGESNAGGIADSTKLGYSELALAGNVVQTDNGYSQAISAGTCGALVFKPSFIVRYQGI